MAVAGETVPQDGYEQFFNIAKGDLRSVGNQTEDIISSDAGVQTLAQTVEKALCCFGSLTEATRASDAVALTVEDSQTEAAAVDNARSLLTTCKARWADYTQDDAVDDEVEQAHGPLFLDGDRDRAPCGTEAAGLEHPVGPTISKKK